MSLADFLATDRQPLTCRRHGVIENLAAPWSCSVCGATLRAAPDLTSVNVRADLDGRPRNMFRFRELLPVQGEPRTGAHTGWTPLVEARRLGGALGLDNVYLKLDCYNWPTYSYKDRVVASALQRALELGATTVSCVSTGNVGNSVAAMAAAAGLKAVIFYPAGLEPAKNIMCLVHGASVIELDGTFDEVNAICRRLAVDTDVPFVNLTLRPFYAEGAKTVSYEIVEQLGWLQPDHVVVPTAGAALLTRLAYGFEELSVLGVTSGPVPRLHAAQASGCAPIANAFSAGRAVTTPVVPDTIAKSLAIGNPGDGSVALEVISDSSGSAQAVSDERILAAIDLLATTEGVYAEPAGGTAVAATRQLVESGAVAPDDLVVIIISGTGLKTQEVNTGVLGEISRTSTDYDTARSLFLEKA
jgi:threonine synthase